jgi:hypothetical protein
MLFFKDKINSGLERFFNVKSETTADETSEQNVIAE